MRRFRILSILVILAMMIGVLPVQMQPVMAASPSDLFFSEYIEGSGNNKALEIYNGTGAAVDLSAGGYNVQMFFNGSASAGLTINLTGTVADGDVYVVAQSSAEAAILAQADQTQGSGWFNGNDAVILRKGTTNLDVIGQIGFDPGSEWGSGLTSTADNTLRRMASVCAGDPDGSNVFDPALEWDGYATNTFDGLGAHTASCGAPPGTPVLVINEIDYDQPSTDTAEFVEIKNTGTASADLSEYTLELVNGNGGAVYSSTTLPAESLAPGDYFVVCANAATVANCDLDISPDTNLIQNGAPDAVGLRHNGDLVDAVSYEGDTIAPYTEGSGIGLEDNGVDGSISRCPDGVDTDQNNVDFVFAGISTPGSTNACTPPPPEACGDPYTPIYEVQGSGTASPLVGTEVAVEGVVVGDYQNNATPDSGDLNGFFVQDAAGDGNPATSDGIFVYGGNLDVSVGDGVRVRGSVSEYHNLTEIGASQIWGCSTGNDVPAPVVLSLPVTSVDDLEPYEGELVTFPQALVISEYFNYDRYGEIVLTSQRHLTPTAEYEPGSPEEMQAAQEYLLDKVTLDDGRSAQNPDPAIHPNGSVFNLDNLFRGGDTVANATGLLDQFDAPYRIQPVQGADYTSQNPRPAQPEDVGGSLKVVSMNVFNYFSTIDQGTGYWICGPSQDMECRGADTAEEFVRQRDKIIAAIGVMDADVIGLLEIENNINDEAVDDLVSGLNTALGAGTYEAVHTGVIGTDAIKVALIYKPASVSLVGSYAILDSSVDPRFIDTKNRPALAQTFMDNETGGIFTVAVNHLKSKGSACDDVGDPDLGDGSGNCNVTRTLAAQALVDWLATDPTGSGDRDYLIIGDLNSYDKEDPIDAIKAGADDVLGTADDYTDLVFDYGGEGAYSYVFDGQIGYLDYALASANLAAQVTGATEWHVNADEPDLIDYDMTYKLPAQDALYAPDPYRYSDHDPVIVGLNVVDLTANAGGPYTTLEGIPVQVSASDPSGSDVTFAWDLDNNGTFETPDQTVMFTSVSTPGVYTIKVMVTDTHGRFKVAETTVQVFYAYRIPVIAKN